MSRLLAEMRKLPAAEAMTRGASGDAPGAAACAQSCAVTLVIPARNCAHALEHTVREADRYLASRFGDDCEIVLVPNPVPENAGDPSPALAEKLARAYSRVRVVPYLGTPGKGGAVRAGFLASRGRWIFLTDADLPYDLSFFDRAAERLGKGYAWVTGNRRLPSSVFDVPVSLLPVAYGRHRLGLAFNTVARGLLGIRTTDSQAGIKAMSRELALAAFARQGCPGFFFDLELFLAAEQGGFPRAELPVTLRLDTEKSTVRVLRQSWLAGWWLTRIAWRRARGRYGRVRGVLSRYLGAAGGVGDRIFLALRWWLTPYREMAEALPVSGEILDLGCGHGLLSLALAQGSRARRVRGTDHDPARIELARKAAAGVSNLEFALGDMTAPARERALAGMAIIDALHYFPPDRQEQLAREAFERLAPGGVLIAREVNPDGGLAASWNRLYERIATGVGFTRTTRERLHFRAPEQWARLFERAGFEVAYRRCSSRLFADILFVCTRPQAGDCTRPLAGDCTRPEAPA